LPAAVVAGGVVAVALVFALAGVDRVEVVGTLLFAGVFMAAMLRGRTVGYAAAGAATLVYLVLRLGDTGSSGTFGVVMLVAARAACYVAVAYATPMVERRLADMLGAAVRQRKPRRAAVRDDDAVAYASLDEAGVDAAAQAYLPPEYATDYGAPDYPPPNYAGPEYPAPEPVPAGYPPPEYAGQEYPPPAYPVPEYEPVGAEGPVGADGMDDYAEVAYAAAAPVPSDHAPVDRWADPVTDVPPPEVPAAATWGPPTEAPLAADNGGWHDEWDDVPASTASRWDEYVPPAPTVPTGWVDDATVPLGDSNIPLGYTGELFLPKDLEGDSGPRLSAAVSSTNGSSNGGAHGPVHTYSNSQTRPSSYSNGGGPEGPSGPGGGAGHRTPGGAGGSEGIDPETRLWNARSFRDRLSVARDEARMNRAPFSVVMVQVPDEPFQALPYRRQVALLRELGHQFIQARMIDHLVHLPDGAKHWFAVVLPGTDRTQAHSLERRLRGAIAAYLRSRGLHLGEVQSASLTSPDDDEAMGAVWSSLLGPTSVS
jgi:hypothetical protein